MKYRSEKGGAISFPLGGIGSGCVGLSGNGRLIDWEIFNRPSKGSALGFTHLAVKAERTGAPVVARVLQADECPPFTGRYRDGQFGGYGFGVDTITMAGMPHFTSCEFDAEFPFATLRFSREEFPVEVTLRAFSPFIPLNDFDSSLPGACFEVVFFNDTEEEYELTSLFALGNHFALPGGCIADGKAGSRSLRFSSRTADPASPEFGEMTLATDANSTSVQHFWFRGAWFDTLTKYWHDFARAGELSDRIYPEDDKAQGGDTGMVAARLKLAPGERRSVRWALAWYFPNMTNYWNPPTAECGEGCCCHGPDTPEGNGWHNYYAKNFSGSDQVAAYLLKEWPRLEEESDRFRRSLYASTLPDFALDAVAANLTTLKSPTCLRLEDGSFYGFEGCHCQSGCCEGSCTHVWNYAYALPFLFPKLERSMRELDFRYNQDDAGGMCFRLQLPLGRSRWKFRACIDGQMGGVIKAYREWKISGDNAWLKQWWPQIRASIAYAWSPDNADRWDPERTGVIHGRQHHTLDMELFGPNSWLTGFYLGALKAGAEMAEALGESADAVEFRALFEKGRRWVAEHLFNGEYFCQEIDLNDRSILTPFDLGDALCNGNYWDEESGEIKYQIGSGSIIDQVLAQWHANLIGLGDLFDPEQVRTALKSLYRYNFKETMREYANPCRVFSLNDESGLVICEWPREEGKPVIGVPYAQETMYGFEYQAGIHMLQSGLAEEGWRVIRSVRARCDGERRNPFNEFECGSNYARSMASYAILNAASGFRFDLTRGEIGFAPMLEERPFRCFWSLEGGWGVFELTETEARLKLEYGRLELRAFSLPEALAASVKQVTCDGKPVAFEPVGGGLLRFKSAQPVAEALVFHFA